ncbi:phage tail-collar fiber domain-containing protein [Shewanella baltica]|uniref:phage tail-collar fiber domain-containing protein n=1 Tax=Shewanella baltica TaxID=62322 RepID=UPI00217D274F|nr:phage tail protein [Shewanella baltica]
MAQVITLAGERLFALKAQNNEQLDIDTFIFANAPGQDSSAPIDRNEGLPPVGQRVHSQIVQQTALINENAVVYSSLLDSLTGPFEFNWVGLYSSVNQTLVAISHIPTVQKTVTEPGAAGNTLNRNFVIEYSGIAELAGITVEPGTWQIDHNARLNGMDELTRQLAADMNGKDWFIDDGFKIEPRGTVNTFKVTAGAGYVSGLRVTLAADHILTLSSYPKFVYVDAWFDGTSESVWKGQTAFTVTNTEMDDYIDVNGKQHYVFKLALITAADTVDDLRIKIEKEKKSEKNLANANITAGLAANGNRLNIINIADSFGDGVGATRFENRYSNAVDAMINVSMPRGMGCGTNTRMTDIINVINSGVVTNGTVLTSNPLESFINLNSGEYIELTGIEVDAADIFYIGELTTGNLNVYLNGVQYQHFVTDKTAGIKSTYGNGPTPRRTTSEDIIKIVAVDGKVAVTAFQPTRSPANSAYFFRFSHGGWTYSNYDNSNVIEEIAAYANFGGVPSVFIMQLGTNSIYNNNVAQTPKELTNSIISLTTKLRNATVMAGFILCVPPQSNESLWPVIKDGYKYSDYVDELLLFSKDNNIQLIRLDLLDMNLKGMLSDGLHPTDGGHLLIADAYADTLGLVKTAFTGDQTRTSIKYESVDYNDVWSDFDSLSGVKGIREGNIKSLSGYARKNGSASNVICTINNQEDWPRNRDPQFICVNDAGFSTVAVSRSSGIIQISGGDPFSEWICLDSIVYAVNNT